MKRLSKQELATLEFCMRKLRRIALAAAVAVAMMLPAGLRVAQAQSGASPTHAAPPNFSLVGLALNESLRINVVAPLAAQGGCQAVDEAMNKVITVPTHIYGAMSPILSNGSAPRPSDTIHNETIYVAGSAYVKVSGKWSRSEWTLQRLMKQEQENRQQSNFTCRYERDESVNGEAAAVYSTHSERSDADIGHIVSDGRIWISKSKGLPLRQEMDVDAGHGMKDHHSVRYEYTNVQPPL
jgi:hypothetical protein